MRKSEYVTLLFAVVVFLAASKSRPVVQEKKSNVAAGRTRNSSVKKSNVAAGRTPQKQSVCEVAKAMQAKPLTVKTYWHGRPGAVPHSRVVHAASHLCQEQDKTGLVALSSSQKNRKVHSEAIFIFKAARTGSTLFTEAMAESLGKIRPTSKNWEPFGSYVCDGDIMDPKKIERVLRRLLTAQCRKWEDKCVPDQFCSAKVAPKDSVHLVAANPRFFNTALDWNNVFDKSVKQTKRVHIVTLRRTNLVLMAYSKFHHGGCFGESKFFNLDTLLGCAEHYALGDQELSSSTAHTAAVAAGSSPFLIVYEDSSRDGALVQKTLFEHMGVSHLKFESKNMFQSTKVKKLHSAPFCQFRDLNCTALEAGLVGRYPCLYKQLTKSEKKHSWTTPMLPDGTVDITGDCRVMEPLNEKTHPIRDLRELYQIPH